MQVRAAQEDRYDEVLTDGAMALVGKLHEELDRREQSSEKRYSTAEVLAHLEKL